MTRVFLAALFCILAGCSADDAAYTLYRDSATDGLHAIRIHVASFDAVDGEEYNRENCELARQLFSGQEGVKVKFWCEKGRYRP